MKDESVPDTGEAVSSRMMGWNSAMNIKKEHTALRVVLVLIIVAIVILQIIVIVVASLLFSPITAFPNASTLKGLLAFLIEHSFLSIILIGIACIAPFLNLVGAGLVFALLMPLILAFILSILAAADATYIFVLLKQANGRIPMKRPRILISMAWLSVGFTFLALIFAIVIVALRGKV